MDRLPSDPSQHDPSQALNFDMTENNPFAAIRAETPSPRLLCGTSEMQSPLELFHALYKQPHAPVTKLELDEVLASGSSLGKIVRAVVQVDGEWDTGFSSVSSKMGLMDLMQYANDPEWDPAETFPDVDHDDIEEISYEDVLSCNDQYRLVRVLNRLGFVVSIIPFIPDFNRNYEPNMRLWDSDPFCCNTRKVAEGIFDPFSAPVLRSELQLLAGFQIFKDAEYATELHEKRVKWHNRLGGGNTNIAPPVVLYRTNTWALVREHIQRIVVMAKVVNLWREVASEPDSKAMRNAAKRFKAVATGGVGEAP